MNYPYFFVFNNGIICKQEKYSCSCHADKKGKLKTTSKKSRELVKGKKLIFIRGLEYLFYCLLFYITNVNLFSKEEKTNSKIVSNISNNLKIKPSYVIYTISLITSIILCFIFLWIIPIKLSELMSVFYLGEFFKRFIVGILKVLIFYLFFYLLRFIPSVNQVFRLNGASNLVANNYVNSKMQKYFYRNTNFLSYLVFSFIFCIFMLSLIGLTISSFFNVLVNIVLTLICFSISFEICMILDKYQNRFTRFLSRLTGFLTVIEPSYSEVIVCQTALNEVILLRENKSRLVQNEININSDAIGFSFAYSEVREKLKAAGIYEISDVDWIFATVLNKSRSEIKLLYTISREDYKTIINIANRRAKGEPLSNIFGFQDFYGQRFIVNEKVLTPRPETEILCEQAIKILAKEKKANVLDLCTGSGAIGITISLNTDAKVSLVDISGEALEVAKENAEKLNAKVKFIKSDLFEDVKGKFDMIVSNPPYIKSADIKTLSQEVKKYDPILALDGGSDGYDFYKRIIANAPKYLSKNGYILFEVGFSQGNFVKKLLQKDFENIIIVKDYNKIARVVIAKKKDNYVREDKKD